MRSQCKFDPSLGWIVRMEVWEKEDRPFTVNLEEGVGNDKPRVGLVSLMSAEDALLMARDLLAAAKSSHEADWDEIEQADREECIDLLLKTTDGIEF